MVGAKRRIDHDPDRFAYTDQALTPVTDEEEETFRFPHQDRGRQGGDRSPQEGRRADALTP
jgi:hypothetical protein